MRALYQWDPSESSLRNSPLRNKKKHASSGWKNFETNQKPSVFSRLGLPQDPKGEGNRLESTSEQPQINFQKGEKTAFLAWEMVKMALTNGQIWPKILILEVIYRPFEEKIHLKVRLLRPETMPKQLLNISKTTF